MTRAGEDRSVADARSLRSRMPDAECPDAVVLGAACGPPAPSGHVGAAPVIHLGGRRDGRDPDAGTARIELLSGDGDGDGANG